MTAGVAARAALAAWLGGHAGDVEPPLAVSRIGAGQSNVTSLVRDAAGREWVLRHPPPGASASTHDVGREVAVLRALAATPVPVPVVVGEGADDAGVEGPFFVMERAPGQVIGDEEAAASLHRDLRRELGVQVPEVLALLHLLDPDAVGLGGLGPPEGYLERQARRTARNWERWGPDSPADPLWQECRRLITTALPRQQRCVIAHGDYRLSNLLVVAGHISAVLDWELCTLGDPLADLAWLADDWRSPADAGIVMPSPTKEGGFPAREEIVASYAARTGLDVSELDRYRAFTHWKAATLLQGVLIRRRSGGLGDHAPLDLRAAEDSIMFLLEEARALI